MVTTNNIQKTWLDVNGFTGSNALTITTLTSNPKIRVHFTIRGEFSLTFVHNVYFQLTRSINGGTPVELNATGTTYPSLTTTMISDHDNSTTSMDSYEIYFVDEITANVGSTIVYVPQVRWDSLTTMTFQLNRNYTTQQSYENTISFSEVEEILTGPPLTVNNVAISSTPTAGDFIQYNGSAYVTGVPQLPYLRMLYNSNSNSSITVTNSGSADIYFTESSQSSHNIFTVGGSNKNQVTLPAGTYILNQSVQFGVTSQTGLSTVSLYPKIGSSALHLIGKNIQTTGLDCISSQDIFTVSETTTVHLEFS